MKIRIREFILAVLLVLSVAGCSSSHNAPPVDSYSPADNNYNSDNQASNSDNQASSPEPLPEYTFEEITVSSPTFFSEGGDAFTVRSEEANYYGEITIGGQSYVDGASGHIEGTYALFVADVGSTRLGAAIKEDGYYLMSTTRGKIVGSDVEYPFDVNVNASAMNTCRQNLDVPLPVNNLTRSVLLWNRSQSIGAEARFELLSVVITPDEAVRYVQDGTLPKALQGLTVTGLDEIFSASKEDAPPESLPPTGASVTVVEVIEPQYVKVTNFSEGLAAVAPNRPGGGSLLYGYIDKDGNEVVQAQYDVAGGFSDGMALVRRNSKSGLGFIDKTGHEVVRIGHFDSSGIGSFSNGFACVALNGKYGFIDTSLNAAIPLQYERAMSFSEGLAWVRLDGVWRVIDTSGNEVFTLSESYNRIEPFRDGLALVETSDNSRGFIDTTGNVAVPFNYRGGSRGAIEDGLSGYFFDGLAAVTISIDGNAAYGYIDKAGNEVVPFGKYDIIWDFSDGLARVQQHGGGYSFIDVTGREIVPPGKYGNIEKFSDGLAAVRAMDGKWGFIDTSGNEVFPTTLDYSTVLSPSDGMAAVEIGGKWGFISVTRN